MADARSKLLRKHRLYAKRRVMTEAYVAALQEQQSQADLLWVLANTWAIALYGGRVMPFGPRTPNRGDRRASFHSMRHKGRPRRG